MFYEYNDHMRSKSISLTGKLQSSSGPWILSLLRAGLQMIQTLLSAGVALFTTILLLLVNQKQRDYDTWQDKIKEDR